MMSEKYERKSDVCRHSYVVNANANSQCRISFGAWTERWSDGSPFSTGLVYMKKIICSGLLIFTRLISSMSYSGAMAQNKSKTLTTAAIPGTLSHSFLSLILSCSPT